MRKELVRLGLSPNIVNRCMELIRTSNQEPEIIRRDDDNKCAVLEWRQYGSGGQLAGRVIVWVSETDTDYQLWGGMPWWKDAISDVKKNRRSSRACR